MFSPIERLPFTTKNVTQNFNFIIIQKISRSIYESTNTSVLVKNIAALGLNSVCFYSSNNNPILPCSAIVPVISYSNADIQKIAILNDNKNRVGIYR